MKAIQQQRGLTQISWIGVIALAILAFVTMVRLVPVYLESLSVGKSLESLAEDPSIKRMSVYKMQETLARRFYVNDVKNVDAKNLKVVKEGDQIRFDIEYEVRVPAVGNVDFMLKFDKKATTE